MNAWVAGVIEGGGWCTARAEMTRTVSGRPGQRPDIIVRPSGAGSANRAVIIELETDRNNLEREVEARVGVTLSEGNVVPSCVAGVLFPDELAYLGDGGRFKAALAEAELEYFMHDGTRRFPDTGYLKGTITDVATAARLSMIPEGAMRKYIETIRNEITAISAVLASTGDGTKTDITKILGYGRDPDAVYGMSDDQAGYMAALMMLNAAIFYEELAKHLKGVKPLTSLGSIPGKATKHDVILGMNRVLDVDYAPVFVIARKLLNAIPDGPAGSIIDAVMGAVSRVMRLGMQNSGDVYGALYQNDLIERKKSASFYTRPEAASLLASLVLPPAGDELWMDVERIKRLRIADFACGTGMLLTAAYNHIICSHANDHRTGEMHPHIMGNVLWGFDIMPTATHLTVSNLASLYPESTFTVSRIYQMPIGTEMTTGRKSPSARRKRPTYALGSLDLIRNADSDMDKGSIVLDATAFAAGDMRAGERHGGQGGESLSSVRLRSESFDYTIMNPPFVRATNHGGDRQDPVPPFAVFGITRGRQDAMRKINSNIYSGTCSSGNAGLASYFLAISHAKLKPGGVMGFVLPATVTSGAAWEEVRHTLNRWYQDITVVRLHRSAETGEATFSSSTGMEEVLLTARKRRVERPEGEPPRIRFVLLDRLPASRLEGIEVAKAIRSTRPNILEHGMGGTSLRLGGARIGDMLDCPVKGGQWMLPRTSNLFLLQFAYGLAAGNLGIKTTALGDVADMGKVDRDIADGKSGGPPRAPFVRVPYDEKLAYQCLWGNDSQTQRTMAVKPDCSLEKKRDAAPEHVDRVWQTATRTCLNRQARYTSQRLIAAYTEEASLGGSGWPNVRLRDAAHDKAFTVWCNSVFGILCYWVVAGSQHTGRGRMSSVAFRTMSVMDFAQLTGEQMRRFDTLFDATRDESMLPINRLDEDRTRQSLDRGILDILGVEMDLERIYGQIVREPQFGRNPAVV